MLGKFRVILPLLGLICMIAISWPAASGDDGGGYTNVSIASVFQLPPADPPVRVRGTSLLTRNDKNLAVLLNTAELNPGYVYTVWWIVFNFPQHCVGGCGVDDFARAKVQASVFWGTGRGADMFGQATLTSNTEAGGPAPGEVLFGPGLVNPNAEIHFVVRCHGPASTLTMQQLREALTSFDGGCKTIGGPNDCTDVQFAAHKSRRKDED